ncbi:uncharacterized protein AB675_299 [Cyphellophora attinorum]|uniref:Uncharacterized protein n=1 Tax=Cyphellophora attinorum TaxID=1664694 RepID=A0A0N1HYQ9_9EURO|nr:uncharacterized protein AB675_299 [Phialophora attinorum]KPI46056.1 hypothetical protein AB675_299 [Phialophora attinorum]
MAFNCGITDIAAAVRVAFIIYEYGFNADNAADVRWRAFQNDVRNFGTLLQRLEQSMQDAQSRYIDAGIQARAREAYDPSASALINERDALIGNFNDTLEACDTLLQEHIQFRDRHANAFESILWHVKQQESKMDRLRRRIDFHCEKIRLVIDRLSIDLLTRVDIRLNELIGTTDEILTITQDSNDEIRRLRQFLVGESNLSNGHVVADVHYATEAISERFENSFRTINSSGYSDEMLLQLSFDALHTAFDLFMLARNRDPHKYLLLLKSRWLISRMRSSEVYMRSVFYRHAINRIDQGIRMRIRYGQVTAFGEAVMLALPPEWCEIWPASDPVESIAATVPPEPNPLTPRANEEGVVRIELATDAGSPASFVTVYKHSDENFRIVKDAWTSTGQQVLAPQQVYTREDTLIPRYALPTLPLTAPEISIFCRNEITDFLFANEADLWRFQGALTGHDVAHHENNVLCQFGPSMDSFVCQGKAQLWQDPIVLESEPDMPSSPIPTSPDGTSDHGASASRSRRPSFAPSIARTNTITTTPEGWIADSIKLSALVLLTQLEHGRHRNCFAVIYIELVEGIHIDRNACRCKDDYSQCSKLVLSGVGRGQRQVPVRITVSDLDAQGNPNPNTFDILPFRRPRRPDYKAIKVRQTEHVVLKFADLSAKVAFDKALEFRLALRDRQRNNANLATNAFIHRSNRPLRREEYISQNLSRRASTASTTTSGARPSLQPPALPSHREAREDDPDQPRINDATRSSAAPAQPIPVPARADVFALASRGRGSGQTSGSTQSPSSSLNSSSRDVVRSAASATPIPQALDKQPTTTTTTNNSHPSLLQPPPNQFNLITKPPNTNTMAAYKSVNVASTPTSQRASVSSASEGQQAQKATKAQKALKAYRKFGEIMMGPTYRVSYAS